MEEVSDRLIGHVDSGIGEGLNEPGLVPGEAGAQAVGARTGVLVEPVKRRFNVVAGLGERGRGVTLGLQGPWGCILHAAPQLH